MGNPIDGSEATFDELVLQASGPVIVDFWADWCAPCHTVSIWMKQLAGLFPNELTIVKIDADQNRPLAMAQGVRGLPHVLFFENGKLIHSQADEFDQGGLAVSVKTRFGLG